MHQRDSLAEQLHVASNLQGCHAQTTVAARPLLHRQQSSADCEKLTAPCDQPNLRMYDECLHNISKAADAAGRRQTQPTAGFGGPFHVQQLHLQHLLLKR